MSYNILDLAKINYKTNRKARYLISQLLEYGEERYKTDKIKVQITSDLKYVYIHKFPLPWIWKQRYTPLLIHIPDSYPDVPPIGFYIPHSMCLTTNKPHPHQFCKTFYSQPDLHKLGWDWFCLHLTDFRDWQPKDDPLKPHKLWNYLDIIKIGLTNLEIKM